MSKGWDPLVFPWLALPSPRTGDPLVFPWLALSKLLVPSLCPQGDAGMSKGWGSPGVPLASSPSCQSYPFVPKGMVHLG